MGIAGRPGGVYTVIWVFPWLMPGLPLPVKLGLRFPRLFWG